MTLKNRFVPTPRVGARKYIAADQAAAGNGEHAEQRDVAVGGAQGKIGVVQHQQRPDYAQRHVRAVPQRHAAQHTEPFDALAGRIDQEHQHQ